MPQPPVPDKSIVDSVLAAAGPVMVVGVSDTGKSTLVAGIAHAAADAGARPAVLEADVGQSEHGPPGMMDLLEPAPDPAARPWRTLGQWYVGSTAPYTVMAQCVAGIRRLADRASSLGMHPVLVDTSSFVGNTTGTAYKTAKHDVLRPGLVLAVQFDDEIEFWLRGLGTPVQRVPVAAGVRDKPEGLRIARRAQRLATYFRDAPAHRIPLLGTPLRGTRLGLGETVPPDACGRLSDILGCRVVHAERAGRSVALWAVGVPRHGLDRALEVLRAGRVITLNASLWEGRSVGFVGRDGFCLAQGVIEAVDWVAMAATVRAPFYGIAEAAAVAVGTMRHTLDGSRLPDVPSQET